MLYRSPNPLATATFVAFFFATAVFAQTVEHAVSGTMKIGGSRLLTGGNFSDATVQRPVTLALVLEELDPDPENVVVSSNARTGVVTASRRSVRRAFGNKELLQLTLSTSNVSGFSLALTNRMSSDGIFDFMRLASLAAVNITARTAQPVRALTFTNFGLLTKSEKVSEILSGGSGDLVGYTSTGVASFGLISTNEALVFEGVAAGDASFNGLSPIVTPDGVTNRVPSIKVNAKVQTAPLRTD